MTEVSKKVTCPILIQDRMRREHNHYGLSQDTFTMKLVSEDPRSADGPTVLSVTVAGIPEDELLSYLDASYATVSVDFIP